jgi:integrase
MSFGDLFSWWWNEYGRRRRSPDIDKVARKHLLPTLGGLPLSEVTPARLEGLLVAKTDELAPRSLNHLRGLVHSVFARAIKRDLWSGTNPAALVERRKVPKCPPQYLQPDEAELLLVHLDPHWRPLFAAALFTGMRKGELLGLRKRDVNIRDRTILVGRSYEHDTTKGGYADLIPIAEPLRPFLEAAIRESPSALVFPRPDGTMQPEDVKLDRVLRRVRWDAPASSPATTTAAAGMAAATRRKRRETTQAAARAATCASGRSRSRVTSASTTFATRRPPCSSRRASRSSRCSASCAIRTCASPRRRTVS